MSSDLLFSILPREGKVPMAQNEQKVQKVSKESNLGALSDEEEELHHEELEVRDKYHPKKQAKNPKEQNKQKHNQASSRDADQAPDEEDKKGPKHLDIYV
jgi:hypothetical protein